VGIGVWSRLPAIVAVGLAVLGGSALGRSIAASRSAAGSTLVPSRSRVSRSGRELVLDGHRWLADGLDAYELASDKGHNTGCGQQPTWQQMERLFSSLRRGAAVRIWADQASMGIDPETGRRDWSGLDRVVDLAANDGIELIFSLANQSGTCDGGQWKDLSWYEEGFREPSHSLAGSVAYLTWVDEVVARYRGSPAIAMWEPVNEPEASNCAPSYSGPSCAEHHTCVSERDAEHALYDFFTVVGGEIHRLDPGSLVEEGTIGADQCGTDGPDFLALGSNPEIDVLSVHDDDASDTPLPGDGVDGERDRLAQADELDKPLVVGEISVVASPTGAHCDSLTTRARVLEHLTSAVTAAGAAGGLVWNWYPTPAPGCALDLGPADPYLADIARR
jgi:mannan endo-1,4-beta-mannosidase